MEHLIREAGANLHEKDRVLDKLAERYNVAQFVSFSPDLQQRFARIQGHEPNESFEGLSNAAAALLTASLEQSVNVRSFAPDNPKSREFLYGLKEVREIVAQVQRLAALGLHTILNETINIHDGGVSGVSLNGVIEFAPDSTPRCVELPGIASLPRGMGLKLLRTVYGFKPDLDNRDRDRVEFSIHPQRRGWKHTHTIIWELETVSDYSISLQPTWPNHFSRMLGDKVFGLLIASLSGLNVPSSLVLNRRIAPFSFGSATATTEYWTRTSPSEPEPGKYTTVKGWVDPFELMRREDPVGKSLASIVVQHGVDALYSGALVANAKEDVTIEGVRGTGDQFMLGKRPPERIPSAVVQTIRQAYETAVRSLGPVKAEWAYDGTKVWILQLHAGATTSSGRTIVAGTVSNYRPFQVSKGLAEFRTFVEAARFAGEGVALRGRVGITSHFGDILRRAGVPSYLDDTD